MTFTFICHLNNCRFAAKRDSQSESLSFRFFSIFGRLLTFLYFCFCHLTVSPTVLPTLSLPTRVPVLRFFSVRLHRKYAHCSLFIYGLHCSCWDLECLISECSIDPRRQHRSRQVVPHRVGEEEDATAFLWAAHS